MTSNLNVVKPEVNLTWEQRREKTINQELQERIDMHVDKSCKLSSYNVSTILKHLQEIALELDKELASFRDDAIYGYSYMTNNEITKSCTQWRHRELIRAAMRKITGSPLID